MSTLRKVSFDYPAELEAVVALLSDPVFLRKRQEDAGAINVDATVEQTSEGVRIVVIQDAALELPALIKQLFRPTTHIVETSLCRREGDAWIVDYQVEVKGTPAQMQGRARFSSIPQGCRFESEFEVSSRVPMLGGALERYLANRMEESFKLLADRNRAELLVRMRQGAPAAAS